MGGEWITTKKRGRDDKAIARDAKRAQNRRKQQRGKPVASKKNNKGPLDDFIADDEEDEVLSDSHLEDDDEEEEEDSFLSKAYKSRKSIPPKKLPHKTIDLVKSSEDEKEDSSNDDDDELLKDPFARVAAAKPGLDLSRSRTRWDSEVDSPPPPTEPRIRSRYFDSKPANVAHPSESRAAAGRTDPTALEDSSSDDERTSRELTRLRQTSKPAAKRGPSGDYEDDEEEAMKWAVAESLKHQRGPTYYDEQGRKEPRKVSNNNSTSSDNDDNAGVVMVESDDDDNDNQDVEYVYEDKESREARSVLETANALSAQVLATMTNWSANASAGMIVDGAVALGSVADHNTHDHDWISQEVMKVVCPEVTLSDYQLVGVNWLALLHGMKCSVEGSRHKTNVNGVLADEMGLGKTVQTIAFLAWLKFTIGGRKPVPKLTQDGALDLCDGDDDDAVSKPSHRMQSSPSLPHLIVTPSSVLSNWEREFENFAPNMYVVRYHGTQAEREELKRELGVHLPGKERVRERLGVEPIDVILVPISYFQSEKPDDRNFLRKFKYDYLVVDEAHLLKNARGTRYVTLDRFKTEHRLLLTGTPVQNSPKELMSLLCFLMPLFSRKRAVEDFDESLKNDGGERMLQHFVSVEGGKGGSDEQVYRKLKQLFAPFVLRRKKEDVLNQLLPTKTRRVEFVELDEKARSLYDSIISDHIRSKKKTGGGFSREHLFTQLRKAAHHPLLIRTRHRSATEKVHMAEYFHMYGAFQGEGCTRQRVAEELEKFSDFEVHLTALELVEEKPSRRADLERYLLDEGDLFSSAKFVRLRSLLEDLVAKRERVLVFSVWTSCLDLLSCLMEHMKLKYLRMDGSTDVADRQGLIDEFNGDTAIPVFLLSTKACGLGINLTAASVVIIHDLDFNPFNDLQAEDRCHRIGNSKPVTVIKMVSKATVDEDIYMMQERKAKMNAAIMESSDAWNKEAAQDKENVLKTAIDRFRQSPHRLKENESDFQRRDDV